MKKMNKSKKQKPSHGVLSDFAYVYGVMWQEFRVFVVITGLYAVVTTINTTLPPFTSKYVMEVIAGGEALSRNMAILAALLLTTLVCGLISSRSNRWFNLCGINRCHWAFISRLTKKRLSMDYQSLESSTSNDSFHKAYSAVTRGGIDNAFTDVRRAFTFVVQVVIYTVVLASLSPVMIITAGLPPLACFFLNRYVSGWQWRNIDKWTHLDRQVDYISATASDFSCAKDVRLYNMTRWIGKRFKKVRDERLYWYGEFDKRMTACKIVIETVMWLSDLASYVIVIYMVYNGNISAGDFVLYFGSIGNYSTAMWNLSDCLSSFIWIRDNINYYRDYLDIPDKFNHGKGAPLPEGGYEIEFRNVSYTYPNADSPTINNISFTLHAGERLALVGLNGAGKTTLIKLMCGLYDPTGGAVLLNGTDIREFNREEYYSLFSTVFQDFDILPVTLAQNITQLSGAEEKRAEVNSALKKAGLYEKVSSLPLGADTLLAKSVFDEATDFSGGEAQKLALAKALYKDAPLLLLDEPTAALDPISEHNMYLNYAKFSKGKASVFISHRLASTRFCDNIILIENGGIAEQGTHEELLRRNGKYAELFGIQSAYYKEGKSV